ncbi:hypothetical protein [Rosistilla oblonga]|uniref:hypothetical protein n=1 Tax=Rosistilla oblonga TaxID=2527990 RepID=UPI003A97113A
MANVFRIARGGVGHTPRQATYRNLMSELPRDRIIGSRLIEIGHSAFSEPEFVQQGIGPATFRSHYLRLDTGIVLDLFVAELTISDVDTFPMPGETSGLRPSAVLGRRISVIWSDDTSSPLVAFDDGTYLRDANDGFYGNPLHAGHIADDYTPQERAEFIDYWALES